MPDFPTLLHLALDGLALIAVLGVLTWLASLVRRDVSLVDRMWSLMIAGPTLVYAAQTGWQGARAIAVLVLVLAWGIRALGLHHVAQLGPRRGSSATRQFAPATSPASR